MARLQTTPEPRDGSLWNNDCIEIFVAPFENKSEYYHLAVDAGGHVYDAFSQGGKEDARYDLSVIAKVQKQQNSWTIEVAVPLCELGLSHARSALMNFCRERKPALELSSWHGGFGQPQTWQAVPLSLNEKYGMDVRDWDFGHPLPQYGTNTANVKFISAKTAPVKALLYAQEKQQWKLLDAKSVQSAAGSLVRVSLPYLLLPHDKPQGVRLELQSNGHAVFRSTYRLTLPASALVAGLSVPYYYSEENQGYIQLNSFVSDASLKSSSIQLTVQSPEGKILSGQKIYPLRKSMLAGFDISRWREGSGWVTAELITGGKTLARRKLKVLKRPGPFTESAFDAGAAAEYNGPLMVQVLTDALVAENSTNAAYSCAFTPHGWNAGDWMFVDRSDMDSIEGWNQQDDFIENKSAASDTFTSMVYRKPWHGDFTISAGMAFTDRMAPSVELAWDMDTDTQGRHQYHNNVEVVLWDHGINVWRLHIESGKHIWTKAAYCQFTLQKNTRYQLQVTRKGKQLTISVDGHVFGYQEDSLPDEFYAGVTACEGINRLYDFSIS